MFILVYIATPHRTYNKYNKYDKYVKTVLCDICQYKSKKRHLFCVIFVFG